MWKFNINQFTQGGKDKGSASGSPKMLILGGPGSVKQTPEFQNHEIHPISDLSESIPVGNSALLLRPAAREAWWVMADPSDCSGVARPSAMGHRVRWGCGRQGGSGPNDAARDRDRDRPCGGGLVSQANNFKNDTQKDENVRNCKCDGDGHTNDTQNKGCWDVFASPAWLHLGSSFRQKLKGAPQCPPDSGTEPTRWGKKYKLALL